MPFVDGVGPRYSDRVRFVTGLVAAALMVALAGCAGSREVAVPSPTPTGADCLVPVPSAISDLQDDIAATSGATAFNGYGVAAGGHAALTSALASCAPGVLAVNIDNGYGAACAAVRILRTLPTP